MQKSVLAALNKHPAETLKTMNENEIAAVIQYANYQYHNSDKPVFPDSVYDMIKEHLRSISPSHPILDHVGAIVEDDERKVRLPYWMGSMDKIKSDTAVIAKWKVAHPGGVVVSDKLDGVSGMFYWKGGEAKMFTRGNGVEGQTITHLIPFVRNVPDLKAFAPYEEFTVRGELIISKADFHTVKDQGANARNMVSGLMNAKLPNLELAKIIQFVAYELIVPEHEPTKQFQLLKKIGFKNVHTTHMKTQEVGAEALSSVLVKRRQESEFEIDGIIVAHDGNHDRKAGENPKHAFAFKSVAMMDRAETVVTGVEWNVSKDGYIKPVVLLEPVSLSGVTVKRATGFNAKFIVDNGIGVGAKVVVMRSGDVIPTIVETVERADKPDMPEDVRYEWNESGIDIVANASNAKDEIQVKKLEFFFTKVKVNGLSAGILKKFFDAGLDTVGKIFVADKTRLLGVEGFKEKMADKILAALTERIATIDPVVLMDASNAFGRGLGEKKLRLVADRFPRMLTEEAYAPDKTELVGIDGIEQKTAEKFLAGLVAYWKFAKDNDLMRFHRAAAAAADNGPRPPDLPTADLVFEDKGFLFTGVRNKIVEAFITERGGKIKSSISKNVDVLICKDPSATTAKLNEAREMGIEIVSMEAFIEKHGIPV